MSLLKPVERNPATRITPPSRLAAICGQNNERHSFYTFRKFLALPSGSSWLYLQEVLGSGVLRLIFAVNAGVRVETWGTRHQDWFLGKNHLYLAVFTPKTSDFQGFVFTIKALVWRSSLPSKRLISCCLSFHPGR
jgi:hypothetical protein